MPMWRARMRSTILESIVKKGAEKLSDHNYPWCRFRCHRKFDASTRRAPAVVAAPAGAEEASVRDLGTRRAPMLDAALPRREQPLGLALRDLLGAEPRPLRKAIEWRSDPGEDASAGGKTAVRARALVDSLDAVARFLSDRASAPRALADEVDPVVDPLLEHVVRPSSADPPGAPVARTSDSKRSALRVVAWLLAPAPLGAGGACADRVAATLAARCAPPTPKRARLAACVALRHAAVAAPPGARWTPSDPPALLRALADALADAERGRRTHEGVPEPPTRLAVAAADCALAISARVAAAAAADAASSSNQPVGDDERSLWDAVPSLLAVVRAARSWWPPAHRAPIVALDEIARRLDAMTFAAEMERGVADSRRDDSSSAGLGSGPDPGPGRDPGPGPGPSPGPSARPDPSNPPRSLDPSNASRRRRWLARAWKEWAPLMALGGGLEPATEGFESTPTPTPDVGGASLGEGATRVARRLAEAAGAASAEASGDHRAKEALVSALIALALAVGQLGLADGTRRATGEGETTPSRRSDASDALALLRDNAAAALLPALRSPNGVAQELGAALLRAVLVPSARAPGGSWGPEQSALLDGLQPLLEEGDDDASPGVTSLAAALVAAEPTGDGIRRVLRACGATSMPARRNALAVLREATTIGRESTRDEIYAVVAALLPRVGPGESDATARERATRALAAQPTDVVLGAAIRAIASASAARADDAKVAVVLALRAAAERGGAAAAVDAFLRAVSPGGSVLAGGSVGGGGDERDDTENAEAENRAEKAAFDATSVFASWARETPLDDWPAAARAAAKASLASPGATTTVRAVAALAPWTGVPPASRELFRVARDAMRLSEREGDVFRRLAPLLLLRGIPTATWDDRGDGKDDREVLSDDREVLSDDVANLLSDVANLLLDRAADANGDGDETRRVAAELHGRASPCDAAPPRLDRLADAVRAGAWSSARACMFAWCAAFAARGADATVDATFAERLRETLADAAAATSRRPESHTPGSEARVKVDEEDVVKTKTGAMETLAAMARAELEHPRGEAAESDDDDDDDDDDIRGSETLEGALAALSAERRGSAPAWTRAAGLATTANVVVSIARRPFARPAAARAFADIALPRLAAAASARGADADADDALRRAAAFQAAMVAVATATGVPTSGVPTSGVPARAAAVSAAGARRHVATLAAAAAKSLGDDSDDVVARSAAARLAVALLAADDETLLALENSLPKLREGVSVAARARGAPELAGVAAQLLLAMGAAT